jgi:hypothetical protein
MSTYAYIKMSDGNEPLIAIERGHSLIGMSRMSFIDMGRLTYTLIVLPGYSG